MEAQAAAEILRHMGQIPEFRRPNRPHKLSDVIPIAIFAVIRGGGGEWWMLRFSGPAG
jgi:hypothetical protein